MPRTPGVAAAAVRLLFAGPNAAEHAAGVTTAVPAGSRLRGIAIANGTATIDVSRAFAAMAPATRIRMRLAELTYTATQFPTVKRVRLAVAGSIVHSIAGAPVPQPAVRRDFLRRLPAILVSRPAIGARVPATVTVAGSADVFEAALTVRVINARGRLLARRHILATCGTGCRGHYSVAIAYSVLRAQPGTIVIFDSGGGSVAHPHIVRDPGAACPPRSRRSAAVRDGPGDGRLDEVVARVDVPRPALPTLGQEREADAAAAGLLVVGHRVDDRRRG